MRNKFQDASLVAGNIHFNKLLVLRQTALYYVGIRE